MMQLSWLKDINYKPYGKMHDLIRDALGEEYDNSMYGCNPDWLKQREFPNLISLFTFILNIRTTLKRLTHLG